MSLITRTDVTAVKLFNDYVLCGVGSYIQVYHKQPVALVQRLHALKGQKIYGIVPSVDGSKLLVFGGKQFTKLTVKLFENALKLSVSFEAICGDDWFHAGVWITDTDIALLSAHNVVQVWNVKETPSIAAIHKSENNSILYSGLLLPLTNDVLVFSGTVFSEVIISSCKDDEVLHSLKGHKGVIFSIACDAEKQMIVSTSDDRSVRIWGPSNIVNHKHNTKKYWTDIHIECKYELYGHLARVMRCLITNKMVVSVGEDGALCFWDEVGKLIKKKICHQNAPIWSVDGDKTHLVTGGGDGGVILHPLSVASELGETCTIDLDVNVPKKMFFTARNNIVFLTEDGELVYYDVDLKMITNSFKLNHDSTYKLLSLSSCKQIIGIVDMIGNLDVFAENCKDEPSIRHVINTKLNMGKILSMHWAGNRHLVFCTESGEIIVTASNGNKTETVANFILPQCKERWLTASALDSAVKIFALGDRCGNIHIFVNGKNTPIKTFTKVHGRYGPTSITIQNNKIITTGRDGSIKHFVISEDGNTIKYMSSIELNFEWLEKFIDKKGNVICGFQERVFVLFDVKHNQKLIEIPCGGGHRSWDAMRSIERIDNGCYEEFISLIYLKNSNVIISKFQLSKVVSKNITDGTHVKEINCLKLYNSGLDSGVTFCFSGGEDTTFRVSSIVNNESSFHDDLIFKQLSNIRTLKTILLGKDKVLVISAGGRAQLCINIIEFMNINNEVKIECEAVVDFLIKGTDKERRGNKTWRDCAINFDPETRIMDLEVIKRIDEFIIFTGCSDAFLRVFSFKYSEKCTFQHEIDVKFHKTCILKTRSFTLADKDILVTCTTTGEISLWNIDEFRTVDRDRTQTKPFFTMQAKRCGINSVDVTIITDTEILIAAGGDDNAIDLKLLEIQDFNSAKLKQSSVLDKSHCAQVTGVRFIDKKLLLSASIDQRISLSQWSTTNDKLSCEFVRQVYSDVADIQGLELVANESESVTVCVFGKGLEIIKLPKNTKK